MEITANEIKTQTFSEILSDFEKRFQQEYGENFKIKPNGVLANLVKVAALYELDFQDNLTYFTNQLNPNVSEAIWQDALNERIGVYRLEESSTTFVKEINGTANSKIARKSIIIRSEKTTNDFTNVSDFTTDENGTALVEFEAIKAGDVKISQDEKFRIIRAPSSISSLSETIISTVSTGRERESDDLFRIRYANSKALTAQATGRANLSNLGKLVNDSAYLGIHDRNTDKFIEPHFVKIIAKHNTTDTIFAQAILDTFGTGIKFLGSTSVTVKDANGENIKVKFYKAVDVPIDISIVMKITDGEFEETVIKDTKEKILEYVEKRIYGLGSIVYATELIIPILTGNIGVEAIEEIAIKRVSEEEYAEVIELDEDEVPVFDFNQIHIEKETDSESH